MTKFPNHFKFYIESGENPCYFLPFKGKMTWNPSGGGDDQI